MIIPDPIPWEKFEDSMPSNQVGFTLSNDQNGAKNAIADWYKHGSAPYFYLAGPAGTGKTAIIPAIIEACGITGTVCYGTPTGAVALRMRRDGMPATTIHSLCYILEETSFDKKGRPILRFVLNDKSHAKYASLIVLDEASMIDNVTAQDLLSFNTKILVLGDPEQLEPINGMGYFTSQTPDYMLTEIHRQAKDNPIIWASTEIRNDRDVKLCDLGTFKKIKAEELTHDELRYSDQIITGTHDTRRQLNQLLIELEHLPYGLPTMPGYKVMLTKSDTSMGLINGMTGRTVEWATLPDFPNVDGAIDFTQNVYLDYEADGRQILNEMIMHRGLFGDHWNMRDKTQRMNDERMFKNGAYNGMPWDFGYACTVHKAQGSQWDDVLLYDDGMLSWDRQKRKRLLYTALTRASENMIWAI